MLVTDLNGLCSNLKRNQIFHMFILLGVCILLYKMMMSYTQTRNDFTNTSINMLFDLGGNSNMPNSYCKDKNVNLDQILQLLKI